jgi:hypothetical protein
MGGRGARRAPPPAPSAVKGESRRWVLRWTQDLTHSALWGKVTTGERREACTPPHPSPIKGEGRF